MGPYVSVVVNTYNRAQSLERYCLPALSRLTYKNFEVIIVIDCCLDNTLEIVSSYVHKFPKLTIVNNQKPKGISYAKNLGVKKAKGEIIAFTDDDCIVPPSWLDELIEPFVSDAHIMGVWGAIEQHGQTGIEKIIGIGANMAIRRPVFNRFLFDTNLRYFGRSLGEEHDLERRMQYHHLKFVETDKALIKHLLLPAAYRKITALGWFTNLVYAKLKKNPLWRHYFFMAMGFYTAIFSRPAYRSLAKRLPEDAILQSPYCLAKLVIEEKNIIWGVELLYFLLLDIPIRAKVVNLFEEISFRLGEP